MNEYLAPTTPKELPADPWKITRYQPFQDGEITPSTDKAKSPAERLGSATLEFSTPSRDNAQDALTHQVDPTRLSHGFSHPEDVTDPPVFSHEEMPDHEEVFSHEVNIHKSKSDA